MYEYSVGILLLSFLWLVVFLFQSKPRRKAMLFTGFLYASVSVLTFGVHKIILNFFPVSPLYNPAYWRNVNTLFDLNNRTGGLSVEDALFMVFWGGLAAVSFEWFSPGSGWSKRSPTSYLPLVVSLLGYFVLLPTGVNPIYLLILSSLVGGLIIFFVRPDLVMGTFLSALVLTLVYFLCFSVFNLIFPNFISEHYNLSALSGIFLLGLPLEEYLFAFTFALMWGPIYKVIR